MSPKERVLFMAHSIMHMWASPFLGLRLVARLCVAVYIYIYIHTHTSIYFSSFAGSILSYSLWTLAGNNYAGKCYYCYSTTLRALLIMRDNIQEESRKDKGDYKNESRSEKWKKRK